MAKHVEQTSGVRTLTAQDRTDFERAYHALREQRSRTEAPPMQQVRMSLTLWIVRTGLEVNRADFALLDRLCGHQESEPT